MDKLTERYKLHPIEFFAFSREVMEEFLRKHFNIKSTDPVVFVLPSKSDYEIEHGSKSVLGKLIRNKEPNNSLCALIWMFYELRTNLFTIFTGDIEKDDFTSIFPFGCLRGGYEPVYRTIDRDVYSWLFGTVNNSSIFRSITSNQCNYDAVLNACHDTSLSGTEFNNFMYTFDKFQSTKDKTDADKLRLRNILDALSQNKCLPHTEHDILEFQYPYLILLNWSWMPPFRTIPILFHIPKPVWNRSSHLKLAMTDLRCQTMTILLMQRFRHEQFTLHKDLIDIIIKHLFNMELSVMESRSLAKTKVFKSWAACEYEEIRDRCFDLGVSFTFWSTTLKTYILDLACGFDIPEYVREQFRQRLFVEVARMKSCTWITGKIWKKFPNLENIEMEIGSLMVDYFKKVGYSLRCLHCGMIVLEEEDLEAIMDLAINKFV